MASHRTGPLEGSVNLFGGAGAGLDAIAAQGDTGLVTTFDDFDDFIVADSFGGATGFELMGWTLTDVDTPVADAITMNAPTANWLHDSSLYISPGTAADTGGNMQLTHAAWPTLGNTFKRIWLPGTGSGAAILDNTISVFACRIGLANSGTTWDGKMFVGWAEAGDVDVMDRLNGTIDLAGGVEGPLVGFHVAEDGHIDGIAQRTFGTAMVAGTNYLQLASTGWNTGLSAFIPVWFDLALRMHITDQSSASGNGAIDFYARRVMTTATPGLRRHSAGEWRRIGTLINQTPNNDAPLVPTIEVINGGGAPDTAVALDWWAMGFSRNSLKTP